MEQAATAAGKGLICRKMAELRVARQKEIQIRRRRSEISGDLFLDSLGSIKSQVEEGPANEEKLDKLKDDLRRLQTGLNDILAVRTRKEAKRAAIAESVSTTRARMEQLEKKIQDQRMRKDEFAALISQQLLMLEALEEKANEDLTETKNTEEAITWYKKVLGFRTEGGEGVRFIFNNIDLKNPEEEYMFTIRLDGDRYNLMNCDPYVEDINELIKDLNETNDLFKFARTMRERFQAAARNGAPHTTPYVIQDSTSITISSPPPISVDVGMEHQ